ncbi:hypothetical protein Q7P36_002802 [Cladosporium allicinum]
MNTLQSLAITNLTDINAGYNEAVQIARAATMEGIGNGAAVLQEYYTFEEYIARRGNFINRLPEYKHLPNACWVVRKHDANLIFENEQEQLTVREVRRRELAREVEPLLPLPTTANTESLDGFRYCRPEGWPEWRADDDEVGEGDGVERGEWYVKTPGGSEWDVKTPGRSETFYTPATSPVEGRLAAGTTPLASIASPEATLSITDHAELVDPLQQSARAPAPSIGSDVRDVNPAAYIDPSAIVPSITVSDDRQRAATQKETNVEAINGLRLSVDSSLMTPTTNGDQTGPNISHNSTTVSGPKIRTGVEAIDRIRLSIDDSLKASTEIGNQAETNTSHDDTTMFDPKTATGNGAQAAPAASLRGANMTPAKTFEKPDWKALSTTKPQAEVIKSPVEAPKPSPVKEKIFTPDPRVSSMAHYGIVAPIKKKEDTKHVEQSALKAATPVAATPAPPIPIKAVPTVVSTPVPAPLPETSTTTAKTVPVKIAPKSTILPETSTMAAPTVPINIAPKPAPLPETSTDAATPAHKSDSPQESAEPAAKRQKGIRGVAHPVKTPASTAAKKRTPLTKSTPTPTPTTTDSPSTAPTKLARRLASIIAGASLPKTKAEARAAATEHHTRLLAQHNSQPPAPADPNRRTSARNLPKATNPDSMPFFFNRPPPDPTNKQAEQQDFIRCICGVKHDDGENMICCETCEVWQHSACVVPGLTEGKLEALRWECTVCDPWGNREVLKGLRAGVKAKEVKGGKRRAFAAPP